MNEPPTREWLAGRYIEQLPYAPYPIQEEALLAWFTSEQGVLVSAPTGTGKTLIAEAALFEALHTGKVAYYTTPLIALTEQKFHEMQASARRWGFAAEDVGLVTGHRHVNPQARILVVVAEILLNRLLHREAFPFDNVNAVVMDEFHSFNDLERGIVWELSLGLLPASTRLLLLSATVGNAGEFLAWLKRSHNRKLDLIEGRERKVPLTYRWIPDQLLGEQLVLMAKGDEKTRLIPALVFCFNRDECWSVAEMLKGLDILPGEIRAPLLAEINKLDWTQGVGPKLKQMLARGVGVHHAGLLPKYRRVVESLFERKLLSAAICTETLASGINLPARSVVITSLMKGPPGKEKLIDASTAHQIFGRAGRPQFDDRGYVFALSHEDDVKLLRWKEKYDQIPEDTKDPALIKAKKNLKRKKPDRRSTVQYWNESHFEKLKAAPPAKLFSKGGLPWRLLAYLLTLSPEVERIRAFVRKRLLDEPRIVAGEKSLDHMLLSLASGGFVELDPAPPPPAADAAGVEIAAVKNFRAVRAIPTPKLEQMLVFRSVHPFYAVYLLDYLGIADQAERLQMFESILELPRSVLYGVRVPFPDELPPGPLATTILDPELLKRGLIAAPVPPSEEDDDREERRERPPTLAEKLRFLFEALYPEVVDVNTQSVWAAGELFRHGDNFNLYVRTRDLVKQEGIIFRHLLRLIMLTGEFAQVCPKDIEREAWQADLRDLARRLTESCRAVDPSSTDEIIEKAHEGDLVEGEGTTPKAAR